MSVMIVDFRAPGRRKMFYVEQFSSMAEAERPDLFNESQRPETPRGRALRYPPPIRRAFAAFLGGPTRIVLRRTISGRRGAGRPIPRHSRFSDEITNPTPGQGPHSRITNPRSPGQRHASSHRQSDAPSPGHCSRRCFPHPGHRPSSLRISSLPRMPREFHSFSSENR